MQRADTCITGSDPCNNMNPSTINFPYEHIYALHPRHDPVCSQGYTHIVRLHVEIYLEDLAHGGGSQPWYAPHTCTRDKVPHATGSGAPLASFTGEQFRTTSPQNYCKIERIFYSSRKFKPLFNPSLLQRLRIRTVFLGRRMAVRDAVPRRHGCLHPERK
jgi:hypothetical protein